MEDHYDKGYFELTCKHNNKSYMLSLHRESRILDVKQTLFEMTGVRAERMKLLGLYPLKHAAAVLDDSRLMHLDVKQKKTFKMMGTVESKIVEKSNQIMECVQSTSIDNIIVNDLDWADAYDPSEVHQDLKANADCQKMALKTQIHLIHPPRINQNKKLLVLDLDHTLLHFSKSSNLTPEELKRPYMDKFLEEMYKHYDLIVWSQTSWNWLEIKLTELGCLTNPMYKISFVLDRTAMFKVERRYKGKTRKHEVKALQVIWHHFPHWSNKNSVHIDDLARNFVMNADCGLTCSNFSRKDPNHKQDTELLEMGAYLEFIAETMDDFTVIDHSKWRDKLPEIKKRHNR